MVAIVMVKLPFLLVCVALISSLVVYVKSIMLVADAPLIVK